MPILLLTVQLFQLVGADKYKNPRANVVIYVLNPSSDFDEKIMFAHEMPIAMSSRRKTARRFTQLVQDAL